VTWLFSSTNGDLIDLTDPSKVNGIGGSSASPGEHPNLTSSSSKRDPRKRTREETPKEKTTTEMLLRMLLEDRAENKKARKEDMTMMRDMMNEMMPQVCVVIAQDVYMSMHAANSTPM
jgi:hypothetical protein